MIKKVSLAAITSFPLIYFPFIRTTTWKCLNFNCLSCPSDLAGSNILLISFHFLLALVLFPSFLNIYRSNHQAIPKTKTCFTTSFCPGYPHSRIIIGVILISNTIGFHENKSFTKRAQSIQPTAFDACAAFSRIGMSQGHPGPLKYRVIINRVNHC